MLPEKLPEDVASRMFDEFRASAHREAPKARPSRAGAPRVLGQHLRSAAPPGPGGARLRDGGQGLQVPPRADRGDVCPVPLVLAAGRGGLLSCTAV